MLFFESYHFIVPLKILELKYPGGLEHFKRDIPNLTYNDDGQLATARFLRLEEINEFVDLVAKKGLHFHKMDFYSDDFTVFTNLGIWWQAKWLYYNVSVCHYNEN